MKKIRYSLCLILAGAMLIGALPYLTFNGMMEERLFSAMWLLLAFCVIAGNLSGVLFMKRKDEKSTNVNTRKIRTLERQN